MSSIRALLRGRSIRTYLVLLVLATLVPLLVFVAAILTINARLHEQATEEALVDVARVYALAVDRDLSTAEAALYVLAGSALLDRGDLRTFYRRAVEVGSRHGGWIILTDRQNQQILNTSRPYGAALPRGAASETLDFALRTRKSYVSDLYVGAVGHRPLIAVGMPVVRGNEVRFVLDMGLLPDRLAALLNGPERDPSWTVTIFDRKGVVIATAPDTGLVGSSPSPELLTAMRSRREGWLRSRTPRNRPAYFAFARVPHADWSVAIGVPVAGAYADVKRAVYPVAAAAAVALALGVFLAAVLGRRIAAPLATLAAAARHGGAEEELRVATPIAEVEDLGKALRDGRLSQEREERERHRRVAEETRRAVAEDALASVAASEARWRALFEQAGEAVLIGDSVACREANPAACRLLGCAPNELAGRPIVDIVAEDEVGRVGATLSSLRTGTTHVGEWTLVGRGGRRIPVEVNACMLADGRWQASVRDITERRDIERERALVLELERSARAEAEAANRMKDDFLATLSHELRTPLATIASWSRLLRAGHLDAADTTRALDVIDRSVQAQSILARDLLDVSRIIRGDLVLDFRGADVSAIVAEACEALHPLAEAGDLTLECIAEPDVSCACDADRIQQVVWNLVTNALKFTPPGGRVEVRLERVEPQRARLVVTDTGRGIAREFLPRLFERFQQFDVGGRTGTRGLGIGLAIVKHLVERHGGTVTADSPGPGQGATFTVILPLPPVPPPADARTPGSPAQEPPAHFEAQGDVPPLP